MDGNIDYDCEHACPACHREWTHPCALAGGCINPYWSGPCPACVAQTPPRTED